MKEQSDSMEYGSTLIISYKTYVPNPRVYFFDNNSKFILFSSKPIFNSIEILIKYQPNKVSMPSSEHHTTKLVHYDHKKVHSSNPKNIPLSFKPESDCL